MSNLYSDLSNQFPDRIDPNRTFSDVTAEAKPLVEKYYAFFDSGDFANATKVLDDNPTLKNMIINAPMIQYLYDMCISSQRFYLKDVQQYMMDIIKYRDEWSNTSRYTKYDVVSFIRNGARESFMGIVKDIPIGTLPTNLDCFVAMTLRGDRGVSGTGMAPRGTWSVETEYYTNDLVAYKNKWYYAKRDNSQKTPKLISDDWDMIMEVIPQIIISAEQPIAQTYNDIWGEILPNSSTSEPHIQYHQMDNNGNYINLYAQTKAKLVILENGDNAETEINLKAPKNNPTFTGTVSGITQTMVGLPNANNTADNVKNVLSATKLTTPRLINGVNFDGTGNITVTAAANGGTSSACSGNAATATRMQTARTINGVNFDGSAAITVTANPNAHNQGAATITGGTLNGVVLAQTNTSYTTPQLRNVIESTAGPSGGANGDIWLQYK